MTWLQYACYRITRLLYTCYVHTICTYHIYYDILHTESYYMYCHISYTYIYIYIYTHIVYILSQYMYCIYSMPQYTRDVTISSWNKIIENFMENWVIIENWILVSIPSRLSHGLSQKHAEFRRWIHFQMGNKSLYLL